MLERNYEYLTDKVLKDNFGFGDIFNDDLREKLEKQIPNITLVKEGQTKSGRDFVFEINNIVPMKNSEKYVLNGPIKLHTIDPETQKLKTAVFNVYKQSGFKAAEMMKIAQGGFVYRHSYSNGEERHHLISLNSQPGRYEKKKQAATQTTKNDNAEFTVESVFGNKKPIPVEQQAPPSNEYHLFYAKFTLTELAQRFSDLPKFSVNTGQQEINEMMKTVILGGEVKGTFTNNQTGQKVEANISLSKNAKLLVKDNNGNYLRQDNGNYLDFIPIESKQKTEEQKNEQKPEQKEEQKNEQKPEQKEEQKTDQKPEQKEEQKTEQKPEQKEEQKTEQKPEQKPEQKEKQKTEQKPEQKEEQKTEQKPEQKEGQKAEQKDNQKVEKTNNENPVTKLAAELAAKAAIPQESKKHTIK